MSADPPAAAPIRFRIPGAHPRDLVAGISVALVLVPQSLAYAELAGLPSYYGLYASILPPIAAAFFASSPYLQTGPVAVTGILTLGALSALAVPFSPAYIALAALLAVVVGVVRLVLGLGRVGFLAYFMSQPILTGFTTAASILIISTQLPTALGTTPPDDRLLSMAWWSLSHLTEWQPTALVLSAVTVSLVLWGPKLHPLFPGIPVAVIIGIGVSLLLEYSGPVVGDLPTALPSLSVDFPWRSLPDLIVPGAVIAVVGFAEPSAIARHFAALDRHQWEPNREFISQGVANFASGLSGGFPVGGSFARSSINRLAGGRSRWSGAVTGLTVLAFLPFTGVLAPLPRSVLGAIVIGAVVKLIHVKALAQLHRYSRPQAIVAWSTFVFTLLLAPRIDRGVIIGVGLAVLAHLWRELRIDVDTAVTEKTVHLQPRGVLFFGSAPGLDQTLLAELAAHPDADRLILDLRKLGRIDYTGALALQSVTDEARSAGLKVQMIGIPPQSRRLLSRVFGPDNPLLSE